MKTVKHLLLMGLALATAPLAQAQTAQCLPPDRAYTFTGVAASGSGDITYQWFRNGEPIEGATDVSYTLPDYLAKGKNVTFKRGAVSSACPHTTAYTDVTTISFCYLMINGICWASANVATANVFAAKPDMYTHFYQWNRLKAWPATNSIETPDGWNWQVFASPAWTVNPCPEGWRLPTQLEVQNLYDAGFTWAAANSRWGNAVAGGFFGPNHASCSLPSNMAGCIFVSAGGYLDNGSGGHYYQGEYAYYWFEKTLHPEWDFTMNVLTFGSWGVVTDYGHDDGNGCNIRCVQ